MSLQLGQSHSKAAVMISLCLASSGFNTTSDLDVSGPCELADKIVLLGIEGELGNRARQNTANAMRLILPDGDPDILHDHLFIVGELMRLVFRFHMSNLRVPDVTLNRLKGLPRGNSTDACKGLPCGCGAAQRQELLGACDMGYRSPGVPVCAKRLHYLWSS